MNDRKKEKKKENKKRNTKKQINLKRAHTAHTHTLHYTTLHYTTTHTTHTPIIKKKRAHLSALVHSFSEPMAHLRPNHESLHHSLTLLCSALTQTRSLLCSLSLSLSHTHTHNLSLSFLSWEAISLGYSNQGLTNYRKVLRAPRAHSHSMPQGLYGLPSHISLSLEAPPPTVTLCHKRLRNMALTPLSALSLSHTHTHSHF